MDPVSLDQLIRDPRALDSSRTYNDPDEILHLQWLLAESFRRFDFDLRRARGVAGPDQLLLSGSDEAPRAYRKVIEDYYRALARAEKK